MEQAQMTDQGPINLQYATQKREFKAKKELRSKNDRVIFISRLNDKFIKQAENSMNLDQASTQISLNSQNSIIESEEQRIIHNEKVKYRKMIYQQNLNDQKIINKQVQFKNKLQYWLNQCQIIKFDQEMEKQNNIFIACHSIDFALLFKFNLQAIKMAPLQQKNERTQMLIRFLREEPSYNQQKNLEFSKFLCKGCQQKIFYHKQQFEKQINNMVECQNQSCLEYALEFVKAIEPLCINLCKSLYIQNICSRGDDTSIRDLLIQQCVQHNYNIVSQIITKNSLDGKDSQYSLIFNKLDFKKIAKKYQYKKIIYDYRYTYNDSQQSKKLKKIHPLSRDYNLWDKYRKQYKKQHSHSHVLNQDEIYKKIQIFQKKEPNLIIKRLERQIYELRKQHKDQIKQIKQYFEKEMKKKQIQCQQRITQYKRTIQKQKKQSQRRIKRLEQKFQKAIKAINQLKEQNKELKMKLQGMTNQFKKANKAQNQEKEMILQQLQNTDSNLKFLNKRSHEKQRQTFEKQERKAKDSDCWTRFLEWIGYESKKESEDKSKIQQKQ